jgi:NAD+ kinase
VPHEPRANERDGPRTVALVVKRSAYTRALERPDDRMHGLLERGDPSVKNVMATHEEHTATVAEVKAALAEEGADVTRIRSYTFEGNDFDLVITVGGDGTLLRASHNLSETPVLGINSAPSTSVGFFCGARSGEIAAAIKAAMRGKLKRAELNRMQVWVNDEVVHARVLNDALFCHQSPAATSRYIIRYGSVEEEHKSSGFWVGPAAGSTAAQRSAGGKVLPLASKQLQLVAREPYTPTGAPYKLGRVLVKRETELEVRSKSRRMRLYLDGPGTMVRVNLGDVVRFASSPEPLRLLGISPRRKWEG